MPTMYYNLSYDYFILILGFFLFISFLIQNTRIYFFTNLQYGLKRGFITNYRYYSLINKNNHQLNPLFVTGFINGEGCFNIWVAKSSSNSIGWQVQARFIIEVNIKDIDLLYKVQAFFGGIGLITSKKSVARFAIYGLKDITNVILKHFNNYPLQSAKQIDFTLWKECINLMLSKKHLTQEGLEQIISIKAAMNFGESDKLKLSFPKVTPIEKPSVIVNDIALNPFWVTAFIEADGSFYVSIDKKTNKMRPWASVGLNDREKFLLIKINKFFEEIGSVYESPKYNFAEWKVFKLANFNSLIVHFNNYPLQGFKAYNFSIWCEILKLLKNKEQLTQEKIDKIKGLKDKLNKWTP